MVLEVQSLSSDPKYSSNSERVKNKLKLQEILSNRVLNFNLSDLIVELKKNDIPFSQIESMKSLFDSPEIQDLNLTDKIG